MFEVIKVVGNLEISTDGGAIKIRHLNFHEDSRQEVLIYEGTHSLIVALPDEVGLVPVTLQDDSAALSLRRMV